MINTSMAYKRAVIKNREFSIHDTYVFSDGSSPDMGLADFTAYSINEATSESGKFSIGAAVIKKYTASLNNMDEKFSAYDFEGCDIHARVGLKLEDGATEILQKGRYRVVSAKVTGTTIAIEAYDSMLFFDRPYSESTLSYPATIGEIVLDACQRCQVAYDISTLKWPGYTVQTKPTGDTLTFREVISYCAQIQCCYARINHLNQLVFGWYDFDALGSCLDGGIFDGAKPYASGAKVDGGTFDDYSSGAVADGGTFDGLSKYHHLYVLGSQTINTDDITITGIQVTADTEGEEKETYKYGEDGYVLAIEGNPLIQAGQARPVAESIGAQMAGRVFRPLNITCQSDPCIESGDSAIVTDRKQNSYSTVISDTTFSLGGMQTIICDAETPTEKNYTKYGVVNKLIAESKKETEKQLSSYDLAAAQLGQLMAHSMGMYETTQTDPATGSKIKYMHDKPRLEDSRTIWKQTTDAFAVSTDGGQTWNAGLDASGNVLAKVLTAIGINADWINAGAIHSMSIINGNSDANLTIDNQGVLKSSKDGASPSSVTLRHGVIELSCGEPDIRALSKIESSFWLNEEAGYTSQGVQITADRHFILSIGNFKAHVVSENKAYMHTLYGGAEIQGVLAVSGTKSRIVRTNNFGDRLLYCYETPNPMFGDIGQGVIDENGMCYIDLDVVFQETISANHQYQVFLQKEDKGELWVEEKTSTFFAVKGTPGLFFAWEIKAKQREFEYERLNTYDANKVKQDDIDYAENAVDTVLNYYKTMEDTEYEY